MTLFVFITFFLFSSVISVLSDCLLDLNTDFAFIQPYIIQNGEYMMPTSPNGSVLISTKDDLTLSCPGINNRIYFDSRSNGETTLKVNCKNDNIVTVDEWATEFKNIKCRVQPAIVTVKTDVPCYGGNFLYKVGHESLGTFYPLYEVCFDEARIATVYASHTVHPSSIYTQSGKRPEFVEGGMFNTLAMASVYKTKSQQSRFQELLGDEAANQYLSNNQFLARGHLVPRADFSLHSEQRLTFTYGNVAPQWAKGNGGDWAALEAAIRKRVNKHGREVQVHTGTHGIMTLPDASGQDVEIYMAVDKNNNDVLPVPLYFYKLIYEPTTKAAIAFVSINSPFYTKEMIDDLIFCTDICWGNPKLSWIKWRENDDTTTFCCEYGEFTQIIKHFNNLHVNKLFY